jgi:hypothetical protein
MPHTPKPSQYHINRLWMHSRRSLTTNPFTRSLYVETVRLPCRRSWSRTSEIITPEFVLQNGTPLQQPRADYAIWHGNLETYVYPHEPKDRLTSLG